MGFSVGPRNCLAMRFATFEMKMCISSLVSNFKFVPCDKTVLTVERDPKNLLGGPKDGLWIKCEKRWESENLSSVAPLSLIIGTSHSLE